MGPGRRSIVPVFGEYQRDLVWSFQPIFYLMRVLGIDLQTSQSNSKCRRFGFLTLATLMLIYNLVTVLVKHFMQKITEVPNTTKFWVELLRKQSTLTSSILMPVTLVVTTILKWKSLWQQVHEMEHLVNFANFLWHLRKIAIGTSTIVIFFIFLVKLTSLNHHRNGACSCFYVLGLTHKCWLIPFFVWFQDMEGVFRRNMMIITKDNAAAVYNIFIETGNEITDLYIYLTAILFVCLTCIGSISIQIIIKEVRTQIPKLENKSGNRVRKWRQIYGVVHEFIEEIDTFFGPILLIFFARMFIFFIISVFKLTYIEIMDLNISLILQRMIYFAKVILYISMLAYRSHKMKQQVNWLPKSSE